jgi:ribosomal protein S18 acetylase RimI-like enzyme
MNMRSTTMDEKETVAAVVKACGKEVKTYFDIRNLNDYFQAGHVWVMEDNDEMVAFAVAVPLKKSPVVSLYEIGVKPEHRRRGILTLMLNHLRSVHPDRLIRLVVGETNIEARAAYLCRGFREVGTSVTRKGQFIVKMELPA